MLLAFPWLFLSFGLYNLIAFTKGDASVPRAVFDQAIGSVSMASGAVWTVSLGDAIVALTIILLFVEVVRSARGAASLVDHLLGIVLFALCAVEFVLRREAATQVFFVIVLASLIDVSAGFALAVSRTSRGRGSR